MCLPHHARPRYPPTHPLGPSHSATQPPSHPPTHPAARTALCGAYLATGTGSRRACCEPQRPSAAAGHLCGWAAWWVGTACMHEAGRSLRRGQGHAGCKEGCQRPKQHGQAASPLRSIIVTMCAYPMCARGMCTGSLAVLPLLGGPAATSACNRCSSAWRLCSPAGAFLEPRAGHAALAAAQGR